MVVRTRCWTMRAPEESPQKLAGKRTECGGPLRAVGRVLGKFREMRARPRDSPGTLPTREGAIFILAGTSWGMSSKVTFRGHHLLVKSGRSVLTACARTHRPGGACKHMPPAARDPQARANPPLATRSPRSNAPAQRPHTARCARAPATRRAWMHEAAVDHPLD